MSAAYKKQLIEQYFQMWIDRDFSKINDIFDTNIFYRECYGACYLNLNEIHQWISQQLKKQVVQEWSIHTMNNDNDNDYFFVTWTFHAKEEEEYIFDGISEIKFNDNDKISEIIEYETSHETYYPFREEIKL